MRYLAGRRKSAGKGFDEFSVALPEGSILPVRSLFLMNVWPFWLE